MLLLILFTGYLIIYNVFQISVTNDIRFYGLLKTLGTTGRQLRRIIHYQALALSLSPWHVVSFLIYGVSMVGLYTASTLYHCRNVSVKGRIALRKYDQMCIRDRSNTPESMRVYCLPRLKTS